METKTKYLSYFGNVEKVSRLRRGFGGQAKRGTLAHHLSGDTMLGLTLSILFAFLLVGCLSFGLRTVEEMLYSPAEENESIFAVNTVLAADSPNLAQLTEQSHSYVNIKPDEAFTFILKYQNNGTLTWTKDSVYLKSSTTALKFRHNFWPDPFLPAQLQEQSVAPGESGSFKFALQAPVKNNEYNGDFILVNNNIKIKGGEAKVSMNVVEDPSAYKTVKTPIPTPAQPSLATGTVCSLNLNIASAVTGLDNTTCEVKFGLPAEGPDIRVGLFYSDQMISIKNDKAWQVYDKNDTLLASVPAEQVMTFFFNPEKKEYSFDFIDKTVRTTSYLKLINFNNGLYTITNHKDSPSWNPSINYNDFLGDLEIRYNETYERTWLIETLPMEEYVKGIKETSNSYPEEYLKAMAIAARTYAMYHHNKGTKHASEFFDVEATYDQVYKGQVTRIVLPNHASAAEATKGIVATYNNELIVAAYFSRGDGRTRSFEEVWGSVVPYLVSVETPYTADKEKWGHGVGIDATDALYRADKEEGDGWSYDQILKYYYTGIQLEKIY